MGTSGRSCAGTAWVFARNAILIGFLTVLLMELALRALGFSRAVLYEPDSLVGWSGRPGAQGVYLDEGSAEVQISSAGVRDREHSIVKPANVWRVAVLGDSFTDALQVAEDKRFTSVIERLLAGCDAGGGRRVEVLNFGVSGFGTAQEYLLLRDRVLRYAPDVVVLAFLPGNDITDNVRALDPSLASRPYVTLNGSGQIVWDRSFEGTRSFRIKSSTIYRALLSASDFSKVVQTAFFVRDMWRYKRLVAADWEEKQGQLAKSGEPGLSAGVYAPPRTREWQQAWNIAERLIEEMRSLTARSATRFLLVTLSSGIQVDPEVKRSSEAAERHGVADLFYADDRLHVFATQRGIEVLSLARPLAEYARRNKVFLHGFPDKTRRLGMNMNVLGSGHWNERGHQAAGEMIARYLCRRPRLIAGDSDATADSPYMLLVADVAKTHRIAMTEEQDSLFGIDKLNIPRSSIPAVMHVDYSARVQTVHKETNPRYHALIARFKERTGCPAIVNTSFNVRGEPIVCTPEDAFRCFMGTEIETLAMGNCFLSRGKQNPALRKNYESRFELD